MAAVGALMDDSYADRAKKATVASSLRNNAKPPLSQSSLEPPGAISSSNSDTLDSSPAPSTSQTPATSLVLPPSVPMSSASSDQASPARPHSSLPPRNAWSQQNPWKTPTKQPSTSNTATSTTNLDKHQPPLNMSPLSARSELHPSPLKTATKPVQKNADPFVVNYNLNVPSLADASNWPQVGETTTHQHRVRPSVSSTASTVATPASQSPLKSTGDNETELSPSKKAKGEKTKWVPIPPKELQAAADQATRQHHGGSSSKSHSPRVNGRGRRLNEDTSDSKQEGRTTSRSDNRSSPVRAGNTRHDRNPSLTVPSSGSSRRVSPLHMTSSLPSPASNLILERTPDSPSHRRLSPLIASADNLHPHLQTNSDHQAMQNNRLEISSSPQIPMPTPAPFPNRSTTHSRNPSQHAHPPASTMGYPVWAPQMYPIPYYSYPSTYPPPAPNQNPIPNESTTQRPRSPRIRQKRKGRPSPREAPPFAGYRGTALETSDEMVTIEMEFESQDIIEAEDLELSNKGTVDPAMRIRAPWWSWGVPDSRISKFLHRDPELLEPTASAETLGKQSGIVFGALSSGPPSIAAESPIENAILQNGNLPVHPAPPTELGTGYPTWPAPGAGPSSMDIGLAMAMPPPSAHIPPPLYLGMPQPAPSHMPSPASAVSRPDWPARDDVYASAPMQQQPAPIYPYPPYPPYPYPPVNGYAYSGYSSDSNAGRNTYGAEGRGGRPWRDDRYTRGGGRGRYPSRGRGFRGGYGGPRSGSQYPPPGGMPQSPYPASPSQPPNATTVYIPDPTLHQPMYPYPPPGPPQSFVGYRPPVQPVQPAPEQTGATSGRPPSPKPMTHLNIPLEHTQYKLLGQIEYYFSHENVAKDMYLREKMDSKGWVSLQVLQSFPRIQSLHVSDDLIKETLRWSNYVEVRQNHVRMSRNEWQHYARPDATESTVSDVPDQPWYPPPVFYPAYPAGGMQMYPPAPHPYPYYPPPPPHANPYGFSNGIADHILRRPEERMANGNGLVESGTSVGESFDSTPHTTEGEDAETSEEDVVFLIGDPSPMTRPANPQTAIDQPIKKISL